MKRFITSIFLVSLVFLGIGNIANEVKARFESDEKAIQLIKASRVAIGGDSNLAQVRGMTIKASETIYIDTPERQDTLQGGLEINFELPGRYSKRVKMGANGDQFGTVGEEIEIKVTAVDGELPAKLEGQKGVFVFRKDKNGKTKVSSDDSGKVRVTDNKVIIEKEDGTVEEIDLDEAKSQKVIVKRAGNGETIDIVGEGEGDGTWVTEDGKKIKVRKEVHRGHSRHGNEMARMTMALIMNAPFDGSYTYKYAGVENIDGYPSNVIDVTPASGGAFRLFLDAGTSLPRAIAYQSHQINFFFSDKKMSKEQLIEMKKKTAAGAERLMKFDDFRTVGSLNLPHRWTVMNGSKIEKTVDVTSIDINPTDLSSKFGNGKKGVFVIKEKID